MRLVRVGPLPEEPVHAAAEFYRKVLPEVLAHFGAPPRGTDLVLLFQHAPYDHRGWRLAAVQDLARAAAPMRVNAIMGDNEDAIAQTLAYLAAAPGITGQLLAVDGKSGETR